MKRKILLILLAACLGLSACQGQIQPGNDNPGAPAPSNDPTVTKEPAEQSDPAPQTTETQPADPDPVLPALPVEGLGFQTLDDQLIAFLRTKGLENKSFTVSPLSFKAALALTALGAEGETQRQILDALGFESVEALSAWYASVLVGTADFAGRIVGEDRADCAYRIVNAIFHNADCDGEFRESYKELAAGVMAAQASSHPAEALTAAINNWVSDQTEGLIPSLVQDASQAASVLVNALYLKTKWLEPFQDSQLKDFTTVSGETVLKDFIQKTDKFRYYRDDDCQLVVVPMQGGVSMVLILGDGSDLAGKLKAAQVRKVHVTLPRFEVESSFEQKELVECLKAIGCTRMFVDGGAEFDPMFTEELYVDDIIQKAKVKVDDKGLEAAAATAVIMMRATALPNPEEPVEFTADQPFQFCVIREDENPELLFWGQIMD